MSSQVFRGGTNGNFSLIDLNSNLTPISKGIKINPSLNETLCQFLSPGLERIGPYGEGPMSLISLEELYHLRRVKEVQEVRNELKVIPIVTMNKLLELFNKVLPGFAPAEFLNVHEYLNGLLDLQVHQADIDRLVVIGLLALVLLLVVVLIHLLVLLLLVVILLVGLVGGCLVVGRLLLHLLVCLLL